MTGSLRPVVVIGLIVLGLGAVIAVSRWRAARAPEVVPWLNNLSGAEWRAKSEHKRIFAYFTASWCPPCQEMRRNTWTDKTVGQALEKYVPVKLDFDGDKSLAQTYNIQVLPTILILSSSGEPIRQISGYLDAAELTNWLEE